MTFLGTGAGLRRPAALPPAGADVSVGDAAGVAARESSAKEVRKHPSAARNGGSREAKHSLPAHGCKLRHRGVAHRRVAARARALVPASRALGAPAGRPLGFHLPFRKKRRSRRSRQARRRTGENLALSHLPGPSSGQGAVARGPCGHPSLRRIRARCRARAAAARRQQLDPIQASPRTSLGLNAGTRRE